MATSLYSLVALATLAQAPQGFPPTSPGLGESLAALRARLAQDSSDGRAWLGAGRFYLRQLEESDGGGAAHGDGTDTAWARALLDTADQALSRAAELLDAAGAAPEGDSARVLRVGAWSARSRLFWRVHGVAAGPEEWGPPPADLKVPPVLDELGENLLRACPTDGVLLTAQDADSYAAWYMRFARGLRPDLLVVPLAAWREDSALAVRLAADLKLGRRTRGDAWLSELVQQRPVCVSMAFQRPPEGRRRIKWTARPLVWVAGPEEKADRVPPSDFVFAALRVALDEHGAWADPALALYARAARATPALCEALRTFRLIGEVRSCKRNP